MAIPPWPHTGAGRRGQQVGPDRLVSHRRAAERLSKPVGGNDGTSGNDNGSANSDASGANLFLLDLAANTPASHAVNLIAKPVGYGSILRVNAQLQTAGRQTQGTQQALKLVASKKLKVGFRAPVPFPSSLPPP